VQVGDVQASSSDADEERAESMEMAGRLAGSATYRQTQDGAGARDFVEKRYPLPADVLTKATARRVTVRFLAKAANSAAFTTCAS
jgi:hypothetical protein